MPRFFIQTLWKLEDISALQHLCLGNGAWLSGEEFSSMGGGGQFWGLCTGFVLRMKPRLHFYSDFKKVTFTLSLFRTQWHTHLWLIPWMLNEQAFGYPGANCRSCSNSPRSSYWVRESLVFLTRVSSVLGLSYYSSYYLRITHWEFLTSCLSYFLFLHLTNTLHTRYVAGIGLGPGCSWKSNSKQDTICYLGACSVKEKDKPIIID